MRDFLQAQRPSIAGAKV